MRVVVVAAEKSCRELIGRKSRVAGFFFSETFVVRPKALGRREREKVRNAFFFFFVRKKEEDERRRKREKET